MPNRIFFGEKFVSIRDPDLLFIVDECVDTIAGKLETDPGNKWLIEVQGKWKRVLRNQAHNLRDLELGSFVTDEKSRSLVIQVLSETKANILEYGAVVPTHGERKKLFASDYYRVDGAPTQAFSKIINDLINLIKK